MELAKSQAAPPQIAKYSCYRKFLQDFFTYKKSLKSSFSYRRFSQLVGLKSPNYLQLVIQGQRNLTLATADTVAKAMKLSAQEAKYFVALVALDGAASPEEKKRAEKLVFQTARHMQTHYADQSQKEMFSKWYHLAVRELVNLSDFAPNGEYISSKLSGLITPEQADESLRFLLRSGLILEEAGRYRVNEPVFDTGTDIFQHAMMQQYHSQLLQVWARNLEHLGGRDQELGFLTIPVPGSKIPELIKKIRGFQDEIIGWAQGLSDCDRLVQLGTYLLAFEDRETVEPVKLRKVES